VAAAAAEPSLAAAAALRSPPEAAPRAAVAPLPPVLATPAAIVLVAALASAAAGAPVGVLHWQLRHHAADPSSQTPDVIAAALSGAVSVLVLASLLVLARRSAWGIRLAVVAPVLAAAVLTAPAGLLNGATRPGFIGVYVLAGVIAGAASLIGTASRGAPTLAAVLGGGASLVFGALAPLKDLAQGGFVLLYYVLPFGLVGGAIAVAIGFSPVRRR
jgi:hypothetical protein